MHDPGPNGKDTNLTVHGVGDWAIFSGEDGDIGGEETSGKKVPGGLPEDSMFPWVINNEMSQINRDIAPPMDAVPSLTQQETASTRSGLVGLGIYVTGQEPRALPCSSSDSTVSHEVGGPIASAGTSSTHMDVRTPTGVHKSAHSPTTSVDSYACGSHGSDETSPMSSPSTALTTESPPPQTGSPGGWSIDDTISTVSPHVGEEFYRPSNAPSPDISVRPEFAPILIHMTSPAVSNSGSDSSEAEPGSSGNRAPPKEASSEKASNSGQKKRPRDEKNDAHDKESNHHTPGTRTKKAKIDDQQTPLLACPFYKKDPIRHRGCFGYVIKRIAYVRQHLFRNHLQPSHCVVCMSIFNTEEELSEHLRAQSCERRPQCEQPDGITPKQQKELRTMRASHRKSEKDQWYDIFAMLFPGVELPSSPYINQGLSEDMSSFREFMERKGGAIVEETLKTNLPSFETDNPKFREQAQAAVLRIFTEWVDQFGSRDQIRMGEHAPSDEPKGQDFITWSPKGQKKKGIVENSQNVADTEIVVEDKKGNRANTDVIRAIIDVEGKRAASEGAGEQGINDASAEASKTMTPTAQ